MVVEFGSHDELDILEALIHSNRQREKTGEMIGREYRELTTIYTERSRQGQRTDLLSTPITSIANGETSDKYLSEVSESGRLKVDVLPTRKAAADIGMSQPMADRAVQVVSQIDRLTNERKKKVGKEGEQHGIRF